MELRAQNYKELGFTNDFIFAKVMRNPKLCKHLLEVILDLEIEHIEYPEEQKSIDLLLKARSVRLDVYVKDGIGTIYNIEMQTTNPGNLPKRSRYYQGMIDLNLIEKSQDFNMLNQSYVIFICTSDIFGRGRHIYTFENICTQDTSLHLNDETTKIFLNPVSNLDDVDEDLGNFLQYITSGKPMDQFTQELEQEVEEARNNEGWEAEYMTLRMIEMEKYNEGLKEGREQTLCQLVSTMLKKGNSTETIAESLDLDIDEVLKIEQKLYQMV